MTWYGFNANITERKRREQEVQNMRDTLEVLNRHLFNVRENERAVIARDIHDQLGQSLTALKLDADWLRKKTDPQSEEGKKLSGILDLITGTISDVQRISAELRPSILDDIGLEAAVEWYCEEYSGRTGLNVSTEIDVIQSGDMVKNLTVYRILQESLTNVIRHSRAKNVLIRLGLKDNEIILEVHDDGIGIPEDVAVSPKSLGILGMRERVKYAGGSLTIKPSANGGTSVIVNIPIK
ncbi:MAG: sensor histidine kinase [Methanosarcina sp.]|nr:sensor histidine kinase [Methanosarcina sp.]